MKTTTQRLAGAVLPAVAIASLLAAGCASDFSGSSYSQSSARTQQVVYYGEITHIEGATIEGNDGVVGGIAGAVVGGLLGNTIGGGSGRSLAAGVGAVAGAAAGAAVEKGTTKQNGLAIEVKLDNGNVMSVTQTAGSDSFAVGQRVRVLVGAAGKTRVRPF